MQPGAINTYFITATLGSTEGDYTVYFGFRTILGTVLWTTNFITLDTVAPLITLENPPSSVVTNSLLHVRAHRRRGSAMITLW